MTKHDFCANIEYEVFHIGWLWKGSRGVPKQIHQLIKMDFAILVEKTLRAQGYVPVAVPKGVYLEEEKNLYRKGKEDLYATASNHSTETYVEMGLTMDHLRRQAPGFEFKVWSFGTDLSESGEIYWKETEVLSFLLALHGAYEHES